MAIERSGNVPDASVQVEEKVLTLLRDFVLELGIERAARAVSIDASLDRDLGLGSLERVELLLRIEKAFSVKIPEHRIAAARTPRDLAHAVMAEKSKVISHGAEGPTGITPSLEHLSPIAEATAPPASAGTLTEVLSIRAEREPDRPHIYLPQEEGPEEIITYRRLAETAGRVAAGLLERGVVSGERVAIMLPTGADFFFTFFGILFAGGIPVPLYPPFRIDQIEEYARRQAAILKKAEARLLVVSGRIEGVARLLRPLVPSLADIVPFDSLQRSTVTDLWNGRSEAETPSRQTLRETDPALIQFTSGSTGLPKGVLLSHENILANIRAVGEAARFGPDDVGVSWLPLYHDMGLIGSWLAPLYFGIPVTILSPLAFLSRPERWLWAIHYHRGTLSAAPNFAYELCVRKIEPRAIEGLDLHSWRIAFNGAEPVNPDTLIRFTKKFAPYGFREETLFPVYGLAESSVALTFPPIGRPPRIDLISRDRFERDQQAEPAGLAEESKVIMTFGKWLEVDTKTTHRQEPSPLRFASCGLPLPGHEIRIVDEAGNEVKERTCGSLQFRGPSTMQGYYNDPETTAAVFRNGWCDSGDFAYQAEGEIFITGRRKDLIIKAGRNIYPQEVETLAAEVPGIRKGCVAAFGISDPDIGTEKLIVVAETKEEKKEERQRIIETVIERVAAETDVRPDLVLLVPPGVIPKTSSGKLRRSACREAYLKGRIAPRRPPPSLQIARLWLAGLSARLRRFVAIAAQLFYAAYIGVLLLVTLLPLWPVLLLLPRGKSAATLSHFWTRWFLSAVGCRLIVEGKFHLTEARPFLLAANHESYLDVIVLMAALPPGFLFVAKRELIRMPIIGTVLRKAGHLTVDRLDFTESITSAKEIEAAVQRGTSVLVFPEGTFSRVRGIRPFRLGAFKVAVETGTPVCPIAIRGTREVLRPAQWLPKRGPLGVIIGKPISPEGKDWGEILRLRDAIKAEIIRTSGEPAIDLIEATAAKE